MSLSRAAKKFRDQTPQKPEATKPPAEAKKKSQVPAAQPAQPAPPPPPPAEPIQAIEPVPEPQAAPPAEAAEAAPTAAPPKQVRPPKAKRRRFVRERAEKKERSTGPALPPRSTKSTARLLTKNLPPPPAADGPKASR